MKSFAKLCVFLQHVAGFVASKHAIEAYLFIVFLWDVFELIDLLEDLLTHISFEVIEAGPFLGFVFSC